MPLDSSNFDLPLTPLTEGREDETVLILRRAALLIRERGWVQQDFGWSDGPVCAYGAIRDALGLDELTGPVPELVYHPASKALSAYIAATYPELRGESARQRVMQFNDTPGRQPSEVIAALEAAADARRAALRGE